jgi:hypothetical protein
MTTVMMDVDAIDLSPRPPPRRPTHLCEFYTRRVLRFQLGCPMRLIGAFLALPRAWLVVDR